MFAKCLNLFIVGYNICYLELKKKTMEIFVFLSGNFFEKIGRFSQKVGCLLVS